MARKQERADGFVGILNAGTPKLNKFNAEILEALLLEIAKAIHRPPTQNGRAGHIQKVGKILKTVRLIKVHIRGYDPLLNTNRPPIKDKKVISAGQSRDGMICLAHGWNRKG